MRSVDEIGDELYTLPPTNFTAARDAAAAQIRADGDPATARQVAAFKRPTHSAFLVNLLALRRPDVVAGLIDLGERIQAAQGIVSAAELRELTNQRRRALDDALAVCRTLAAATEAGPPSPAQLTEASQTLAAAMADPAAAAQVRAGRVVKALHYAGFGGGFGAVASGAEIRRTAGGSGRTSAQPVQSVKPAAPSAPSPDLTDQVEHQQREQQQREQQQREQERMAWERLAKAEAALAAAQAQERAANEEMDRIADEIARLRGALETAAHRAKQARTARQAAERELAAARRSVDPVR